MKEWYVTYKVLGMAGNHESGPYSFEELKYQRSDIAGYEGVYDVNVKKKISSQNND